MLLQITRSQRQALGRAKLSAKVWRVTRGIVSPFFTFIPIPARLNVAQSVILGRILDVWSRSGMIRLGDKERADHDESRVSL